MREGNIRVMWLASWYPESEILQLGDFIQRQAYAASRFSDIKVVSFIKDTAIRDRVIQRTIVSANLEEIQIRIPSYNKGIIGKIQRIWQTIAAIIVIQREIMSLWSPQIIHLHIVHSLSWVAFFYSRLQKVPLIISEHSSIYLEKYKKVGFLRRYFEKSICASAKKIVVVSSLLKKAMLTNGLNGNYTIIPNVIDTSLFHKSIIINKEYSVFSWVHTSTLAEGIKNIDGILDAVAILCNDRSDFEITFVGGNESLVKKYRLKAEILKIDKQVKFVGQMRQDDMKKQLCLSDAFVNFSDYETFGLSVLEALSCDLPCIATHTGAFDEWIFGTNGLFVQQGNVKQLAEKMAYLMDHFSEFKVEGINELIQKRYAPLAVGKKIVDLYHESLI